MLAANADTLFEVSWEVCNKVGGIYTVVSSKADLMKQKYKNYFLIGPYNTKNSEDEFTEEETPAEFLKIFDQLKKEGIQCHFGKWQIKGLPNVILIDYCNFNYAKNDLKKKYWEEYKIDSLASNNEFDEPLLFSTAAGKFVELYQKNQDNNAQQKIILHAHEWLSAFSILLIKSAKCKVATIFTTHATMLGRMISAANKPLYDILPKIDPIKEAYNYGIQDKHLTEVAAATACDVFTTVSEITALEAEKFYGRKPEMLVLNGLDAEKFPSFEETSVQHRINREKIREFIAYYFFSHYYFDLDQTLLFFIVGRYEFKNKGIDLLIQSLSKLNEQLKKQNSKKTVITFFWIPRDVLSAKQELSENKMNYLRLKNFVHKNDHIIQKNMLHHLLSCDIKCYESESFKTENIFNEEFLVEAKRMRLHFMQKGTPLLTTHNLAGEQQDIILKSFSEYGLDNKKDDKVKVIFYPVYLSGVDGLIDLPYYEAITGCHLGLFPSYYEPWGYTPLESAALGVPSLTTDLGGFGRFINKTRKTEGGIFVLQRMQKTEEEIIKEFTNILESYCSLDEKGRVTQKIIAKELSNLADWNRFIDYYIEAHNMAVRKVF
ncbi:glycosyltransferase [Candidatus Woesearchaeota archaeon]|nr:glycosyltransferase [Candidatus Woesearchaeota archaeon]